MVTNFAMVVGTLLVTLVRAPVAAPPLPADAPSATTAGALRVAATADSFSPSAAPRAKKRRPAGPRRPPASAPAARPSSDEPEEDAPPPARPAARRRPPPAADAAGTDDAASEEEEEEEDKPRNTRKMPRRRPPSEDEEAEGDDEEEEGEEADAPFASLPVILPRLVSFGIGGSLLGRNFAFNAPLQRENAFPRAGVTASLETYPLIRAAHGWLRTLGLGVDLALEFGTAALKDNATGVTASLPVAQRRYSVDVRYAIPAGERVVIVPALGIGNNTFDLKNLMPVTPSECDATPPMPAGSTVAAPCIVDVQATYFIADLHLRVAVSEKFALSLAGGYFLGLAVGQGQGQIGQERTPKMSGFHADLGGTWMLSDWLALRGDIPFLRYGYTFSGGTGAATYTSASETYYGLTISAVLFTR